MAVRNYESGLLGILFEVDHEKCECIGARVDACPMGDIVHSSC